MPPTIRAATPADAAPLAALKRETFHETFVEGFAIPYPAADVALFSAHHHDPTRVAGELADAGRRTWVAEAEGGLIAYAQTGPCKLPHPDASEAHGELYQLYVRRAAQGLGLGARLLGLALETLATERPGPVWLGVWSGNGKAQKLYEAIGFAKVGEYDFPVGNWIDHEFIYRR